MKKLILGLVALFAIPALAVPTDLTIEFDKPVLREDGDPLPDSEIFEYVFYDGCATTPVELLRVSNTGTLSTATTTVDWADGSTHSICFTAVDTDGTEGLFSPSYDFQFDLIGRPGAGSIRSILVTCTAQRCRVVIM